MPKEEKAAGEQEEEIFGYMEQSHISDKNVARLKILAVSENQRIAELAGIVLEVAKVKPYKKRRLQVLARERRNLLDDLERTGLIYAHHWEADAESIIGLCGGHWLEDGGQGRPPHEDDCAPDDVGFF
jgi:hypothetical protein